MSENLDLVRSIYAGWERGDFSSSEWAHPEIEYVWADGPSPSSWKGAALAGDGFRGWMSAWEGFGIEAKEYRELDEERVLALGRASGRGKGSGLDLGQMPTGGAMLFHLRSGQVVRLVVYWDRDRAFADLGLEE
jgi:ketosteroid isomerase-like protein